MDHYSYLRVHVWWIPVSYSSVAERLGKYGVHYSSIGWHTGVPYYTLHAGKNYRPYRLLPQLAHPACAGLKDPPASMARLAFTLLYLSHLSLVSNPIRTFFHFLPCNHVLVLLVLVLDMNILHLFTITSTTNNQLTASSIGVSGAAFVEIRYLTMTKPQC